MRHAIGFIRHRGYLGYAIVLAATLTLAFVGPSSARAEGVDAKEAQAIATEAYIYAYPLVTMDTTRRVMTNVPKFDPQKLRGPMFQFVNAHEYPTAAFKDVTAPNADTLYSAAWLDVSKEPWVVHIPDMGDRYYLFPMLSGWTNVFASPGKRTDVKGGDFAVTGPAFKGKLPEGVKEIKSPTDMVWIIGRIYCTGTPEDFKAVWALQEKLSLTPLSQWGKEYKVPAEVPVDDKVDMKTPPREQVNKMKAAAYFKLAADLMKANPPAEADAAMIAKMAKIGIVPGQEFDISKLDPAVAEALEAGAKAGMEKILAAVENPGKKVNGWQITMTGDYGTQYLFRAAVAYAGLGANLAKDACYPMATEDADGKPLNGANKYVLRFAGKAQLPPVNGFWSLTMYNGDYYFVDNPLNRYTLSQRNDLKANDDGSIDLYLQKDSPGKDKESNWLPAPEGKFILCLRLYWPKEAFLKGEWKPPGVQIVK